jgi:hypothetical protein
VSRFFLGFLTASALWGIVAFLYFDGRLGFLSAEEPAPATGPVAEVGPAAENVPGKAKRKRGKRSPRPGGADNNGNREQQVGDDLDWDGTRNVDMAAGEEQLSGAEIEAGFDSMMGRIRRCLILVPTDGEITGKLLFGMRVGADGRPKAVNLTGPAVVTGGESGSCLREAAQSIRFATFDGPDMLFKYPINLQ